MALGIPFMGKIIDSLINKGSDLISEFITDPDKAAEFTHLSPALTYMSVRGFEKWKGGGVSS